MATSGQYYLNAPSLGSATAVFTNASLTTLAPNGFYSDGTIVREQAGGVLLPQQSCPTCAVPCDSTITANGGQGIYYLDLNTGSSVGDVGAVIVKFNPMTYPNGVRATLGSTVYNKITSSLDGAHKSTTAGNPTFVGMEAYDCGISGTTYPSLPVFEYGSTSFINTGTTQSFTVNSGDVSLSNAAGGSYLMVIPKTVASPSIINFEVVGPCTGATWTMSVDCPALLTGFSSSIMAPTEQAVCLLGETTTYYNASLYNTPGLVGMYDFVFADAYGSVPLAEGFYYAAGSIANDNEWFFVDENGVVAGMGVCAPPPPECNDRRVVFQICNSNAAKDDNFDIYLNNVYIGAVDLNANAQIGSVFIADLNTAVEVTEPDFVCPLSGMVTYHFNPAILQGSNVLEMRNTQNNGNGNFGVIGMRNYQLDGTDLINPCVITNLTYSGGSGQSFTFNFDYTECCAPVWYQITNCADSSVAYSQEYSDGDFAINDRVTTPGQTWTITNVLSSQPSGTLYPLTPTGQTGCTSSGFATLAWGFTEIGGVTGSMNLYVNGILIANAITTTTGTYTVYQGDVITAEINAIGCVSPTVKANVYSSGIIISSVCNDNSASTTTTGYTVTNSDLGTTISLGTFATCDDACV
jgi:hypothetical protein